MRLLNAEPCTETMPTLSPTLTKGKQGNGPPQHPGKQAKGKVRQGLGGKGRQRAYPPSRDFFHKLQWGQAAETAHVLQAMQFLMSAPRPNCTHYRRTALCIYSDGCCTRCIASVQIYSVFQCVCCLITEIKGSLQNPAYYTQMYKSRLNI